jgi:dTDP-4-amino-4,6-dideoxygalactose transaminase
LSSLPAYRELAAAERWKSRNPVSYDVCARAVNLPSGFNMTEPLVVRVVDALNNIVRASSLAAGASAS